MGAVDSTKRAALARSFAEPEQPLTRRKVRLERVQSLEK